MVSQAALVLRVVLVSEASREVPVYQVDLVSLVHKEDKEIQVRLL